jgi:hypothetical protein
MNASDLKLSNFFTTTGQDIWRLDSFCMSPTAEMRNLETGQIENFGMGGHTANNFHRIDMPIKPKECSDD